MKKLSLTFIFILFIGLLTSGSAIALSGEYLTDYLENGNPGGWGTSLKSFDDTITVAVGETFAVDIWMDVGSWNVPIKAYGLWLDYSAGSNKINFTKIQAYGGGCTLFCPWGGLSGPLGVTATALEAAPGQVMMQGRTHSYPDGGGHLILARAEFFVTNSLPAVPFTIDISTIPGTGTWGPNGAPPDWTDSNCITQNLIINVIAAAEICNGIDDDCNGLTDDGLGVTTCGIGDCERTFDNCSGGTPQTCIPGTPVSEYCPGNGIDEDCDGSIDEGCTCIITWPESEVCDMIDNDCNGLTDDDINIFGVPYDCFCNGNFDCDDNVDTYDNDNFLEHYGRSLETLDPCTEGDPCYGDFDCDGDVDTVDQDLFLADLGRNFFSRPCYDASMGCVPLDCEYIETCNGFDDDGDGSTDEGCTEPCPPPCSTQEYCYEIPAIDDDCDGLTDDTCTVNGYSDRCPGDMNADQGVDATDLNLMLVDFGVRFPFFNPCTPGDPMGACEGDLNCDMGVDAADLTIFLDDFGIRFPFFNQCQLEPWAVGKPDAIFCYPCLP